jgi:hypothetical protein
MWNIDLKKKKEEDMKVEGELFGKGKVSSKSGGGKQERITGKDKYYQDTIYTYLKMP